MTGLRQQIDLRPKTFTMSEVVQLMRKEKAARKRPLNSNPMILDQATINAGFDLRR
jgi:hypothetical protein